MMFRSNHARIWRTTSIEYNITQWSVSDNNLPQNKCFSVLCAKSVAIYGGDGGEIVFKKSLHALNPCFTRKLIKNWVLWSWVEEIIQNQLRRGSGTSVKAGHRRFNAYHETVCSARSQALVFLFGLMTPLPSTADYYTIGSRVWKKFLKPLTGRVTP